MLDSFLKVGDGCLKPGEIESLFDYLNTDVPLIAKTIGDLLRKSRDENSFESAMYLLDKLGDYNKYEQESSYGRNRDSIVTNAKAHIERCNPCLDEYTRFAHEREIRFARIFGRLLAEKEITKEPIVLRTSKKQYDPLDIILTK